MFTLLKFLSYFFISPAFFIFSILFCLLLLNKYSYHTYKKLIFILLITFYILSIRPTEELLVRGLENSSEISNYSIEESDAYILLGGGIIEGTPLGDIPSDSAFSRIVETAISYKVYPKPIVISGGRVFENSENSESSVYKKYLINLGINEEDILLEEKSRNTYENAIYSNEILKSKGFTDITLVTSAIHMKRSLMSFKAINEELSVSTISTGYLSNKSSFKPHDFIPSSSSLEVSYRAIWEYVGLVYYFIKNLKKSF